ncbi:hypothetical protein JRO89_XS01G0072700 [Xanthoceras sorbifolium]|uniref:CCHC-type domain-containing protein n=1 Tax=Xanthoceras sorbifolium TaxID=99658 RepID=A0ABQ8IJX2_9ROSI|nr:hypothetical protein JRO89_XS01G0072700 [Xanthoceras sorbifolium]
MERDFLNLKHGSKTIVEYEEQFTSLSRFATQLIPDDESKARNDGHGGSENAFGNVAVIMKNAPPCQYCGRSHAKECYRKTGACFGCGKTGNILKNCPKSRFGPDNALMDED